LFGGKIQPAEHQKPSKAAGLGHVRKSDSLMVPSVKKQQDLWFHLPTELVWLIGQIRPLLSWHLASFFSITSGSLLALVSPLLLKWLVDGILPQKRMGLLVVTVVLIFLSHEGQIALASLGSYLMLSASQKTALNLRMLLLKHLNGLTADYYDQTPVGAVLYRLKEPIEEIAYFGSDLLPAILRTLLTTAFTLTAMAVLSPMLAVAVVPLIPFFLCTRQFFRNKLARDADAVQIHQVTWTNFLQEHLSSAIPIQMLGQERQQERRAHHLLARSLRTQLQLYRTSTWFTISTSLAVAFGMCAVIGYGGKTVLAGGLSTGGLVAFYGFITQLFEPLSGASELYARAQKTFASIRQVQALLRLRPTVVNAPIPVVLSKRHSTDIELGRVEFGYSRSRNLIRIPFLRIGEREHIAIAGENGAGKSTLVKLMARLYDPTSGAVRLGGEDLRNLHLKSLRRVISYLPRDPVLFDGTIASNLLFVRPSSTEPELEKALQQVGLASLVASLPNGLKQRIGPDGCQLSGGERQRLALARAILQDPRIVILDEATSCLDPLSELSILRLLRESLSFSTFIVISHRSTTFPDFARVLFLSHGRITADGDISSLPLAYALPSQSYVTFPG
jgi:ABC-type bacteriocin/lantibiotic exporter with double-glycine peptidase domain